MAKKSQQSSAGSTSKKVEKKEDVRNNPRILGFIAAAVAFLIYANTFNHQYALDDVAVIYQNKFVQQGVAGIPEILTTFYWQGYWDQNAGLYRPMSLIMFAFEWQFFPNQPFIGHFMNAVTYALICFLIVIVFFRLLPQFSPLFSLAIALVFALHPLHTEVVANIKSRDEILSLLFFLISILHLIQYHKTGKKISWIYTGLFFFLALMSKEGALLFLFIYPLIFYFFTKTSWKKIGIFTVPLVLIAGIWFGLHEWVISQAPMAKKEYTYMDNSLVIAPDIISRMATAFSTMGKYFKLLIYPHPLSYDYSYPQVQIVSWSNPSAFIPFILCLALFLYALKDWNKKSIISFSILFFFITLSLTSNIFILIGATMAERFLFVPSLGFAVVLVYLVHLFVAKNNSPQLLIYILSPVFMLYAYKTFARNKAWESDYTLFVNDVVSAPNSSRVHYNAATALLGPALKEQDENKKMKMLDEVISELQTASKLDSNYVQVWNNLGVAYYHRKLYELSVFASRKVLKLNPSDRSVYPNLADAYFTGNQFDSAIIYLKKTIDAELDNANTYNKLGNSFFNLKQYPNAIDAFKNGINKDSTNAELWMNLGNGYGVTGQYPQAISAFNKAYNLNTSNPQPLYFIALTYQNMGDTLNAGIYMRRFNSTQGK